MIRKYLLYAFAFTSLIFTSCMDSFLDRNPYGAIDETTFYTEAEHANLGAMACYAKLQCLNGHWAFAQLELGMTGDFSSAGFKDAQPFYGATFNPNESSIVQSYGRDSAGVFRVRHGSLCRIPPPPERLALRTVLRTLPVGSADAGEPGLAAYCRQSGAAVVSLRRRCLGWDFRRQCTPSETA